MIAADQTTPQPSVSETLIETKKRLAFVAPVGEQTVFPDAIRVGDWADLPMDWPKAVPHIIRGPEYVCGPSLLAVMLEDKVGPIYFPVPPTIAILLGAAYSKGKRTAQADIRKAIGAR
jgi:hypothetical protein